ncbi:unnamed protein product [Spirodela intermedia]|uniref:DC1 domain-containing protein n=1 Tax=Spirodela intermedia TaxID=51605 RepID=A0A7I8J0Z5_SPIIN|nr:unnamed protein product [Spirodela intermedia]CAA6663642.1 unnamed protein product [Spirodela intermedia]
MLYSTLSHHGHPIQLEYSSDPFICDGCKDVGFGLRFTCQRSRYDLHQVCARPRRTLRSAVYLEPVVFDFYGAPPAGERPTNSYRGTTMRLPVQMLAECQICGVEDDGQISAWSYVSSSADASLHVACAKKVLLRRWENERFRVPTAAIAGGGVLPPILNQPQRALPPAIEGQPTSGDPARRAAAVFRRRRGTFL